MNETRMTGIPADYWNISTVVKYHLLDPLVKSLIITTILVKDTRLLSTRIPTIFCSLGNQKF